jgi:hypothetical protein
MPADSPAASRDLATAAGLLTDAGYTRGPDGRWARGGQPLVLRLAAPAQVAPFGRLVTTLGTQLRAAGIDSVVVADGGAKPFPPGRGPVPATTTPVAATPTTTPTTPTTASGAAPTPTSATSTSATTSASTTTAPTTTTTVPLTPDSPSDLAVADVSVLALPRGGDPITDLASVVGCPGGRAPATSGTPIPSQAAAATPLTTEPAPTSNAPAPSTAAAPTSTAARTATGSAPADGAESDLAEPEASEALSPTGFCDPALQSLLDAAMSGAVSTDTALALAEPTLWTALPTIPLFQATSVLAGPAPRTDVVVGPLAGSPFAGADRWVPPPASDRGDDGIN